MCISSLFLPNLQNSFDRTYNKGQIMSLKRVQGVASSYTEENIQYLTTVFLDDSISTKNNGKDVNSITKAKSIISGSVSDSQAE